MCLLGGRRLYKWLGISSGKQGSDEKQLTPSISSAPPQESSHKEPMKEEEEEPFQAAHKSDSQLLELTKNGLRSLHRKLELVVLPKTNSDVLCYWE
ncbi:hypothetical protein PMAYCL1PPCAC_29453, partial [Pristionchus mayeri]